MKFIFNVFLVLSFWSFSNGKGNVRMILEQFDIECDPQLCETAGTMKFLNRTTKAVNFNFTLFKPLKENAIAVIDVYRWVNQNFEHYQPLHMQPKMSTLMSMGPFGVKRIFQVYSKPPMLWPLQANIKYKIRNYTPEVKTIPAIYTGLYLVKIQFKNSKDEEPVWKLEFRTLVEDTM